MKKKLNYERMFSDLILKDNLLELPVGGILEIDVRKYYKNIRAFPDRWLDVNFMFKSKLDKLFYITKIPFMIRGWKYNHVLEIEKYGEEFNNNKYLKYIEEGVFEFKRKQTDWARGILNKYRIRKEFESKDNKKEGWI